MFDAKNVTWIRSIHCYKYVVLHIDNKSQTGREETNWGEKTRDKPLRDLLTSTRKLLGYGPVYSFRNPWPSSDCRGMCWIATCLSCLVAIVPCLIWTTALDVQLEWSSQLLRVQNMTIHIKGRHYLSSKQSLKMVNPSCSSSVHSGSFANQVYLKSLHHKMHSMSSSRSQSIGGEGHCYLSRRHNKKERWLCFTSSHWLIKSLTTDEIGFNFQFLSFSKWYIF